MHNTLEIHQYSFYDKRYKSKTGFPETWLGAAKITDWVDSKNYTIEPVDLSTDEATNDDFTLDFMHNINGDMLIQLLATSPFNVVLSLPTITKSTIPCCMRCPPVLSTITVCAIPCWSYSKAVRFAP